MTSRFEGLIGASAVAGPIKLADSRLGIVHSLLWSTAELHTNDVAMSVTPFGRRVAAGPWVAALAAGIIDEGEGRRLLAEYELRLGPLQSNHITYHAPIAAGSVFSVRSEICDVTLDPETDAPVMITITDTCQLETGEVAIRSLRKHRIERARGGAK